MKRHAKLTSRPSYDDAIGLVAMNEALDMVNTVLISELPSVALICELWGCNALDVARDIMDFIVKYRAWEERCVAYDIGHVIPNN